MEFISIKQLQKLARDISKKVKVGDTIYLQGEIGVGKTTFSRFLIQSIQKKNKNRIDIILKHTKDSNLRTCNVKYYGRFKK